MTEAQATTELITSEAEVFDAIERELCTLLRRARAISAEMGRRVHPDLDPEAYGLLAGIHDHGRARASELAGHFGLGKATVSRQLTVLAELGLIKREPDPADGRAHVLALTADGHEGQTYELTSDDHFTTVQLGEILSKALGKKLALFEGDEAALRSALVACGAPPEYAPVMSHYFETVADGRWRTTDTVSRLLGRKPGGYREWLTRNLPDILKVFKGAA